MSTTADGSSCLLDSIASAEAEYARRVRRGGYFSALAFALNNRSVAARGIFVRAASDGLFGLADLDALLTASRARPGEPLTQLLRTLDVKPLLALAGLIANQRLRPTDLADAGQLYGLILQAFGAKVFSRIDRMTYLELLAESASAEPFARTAGALPLPQGDWRQVMLLLANVANPWRSGAPADLHRWTSYLGSIFNQDGVEPISAMATAASPFDRILCTSTRMVRGGPKVTVLVPTHDPGVRLGTAMAALVNQTWSNLEILLLDDGSAPSHRRYMDAWAERDHRIRVLHLRANIGNYAARNIGLREADGEFVTVHDDDDWSHPRKLEVQARHLIATPGAVANMSQLVRATSALAFTRINGNTSFIQPNYSSLMFRREPVVDEIGYWDEVNRAGDAEYRHRLTAHFGVLPDVVGAAPLSFLRVREHSLTSGEICRGYSDVRRRWHESSSRVWHRRAGAGQESLYLRAGPTPRRFSAPASMLGPGCRQRQRVDVLYATDFRFPGGNSSVSNNEIRALLAHGYRVGLVQIDSPVLGTTNELHEAICETALHPGCSVFSLRDEVVTDVLLVRHPTVLQYAEPVRSAVSAAQAVLIVNHAPQMRDGSGAHYDIATCVENFQAVFGRAPRIAPESGAMRAALRDHLDGALLTDEDWNGIVATSGGTARRADATRRPVLGRHSRDAADKWPGDVEELLAVYPADGSRDVRVLGGADTVLARLAPRQVRGWTVYPFGALEPEEFLRQIDFWAYFHAEHLIESFGMATAEAMASGAVVILPHYMEPTFGEGAVYCKPDEVQHVVDELWRQPVKYAEQSRAGVTTAARRFTVDSFLGRIAALSSAPVAG